MKKTIITLSIILAIMLTSFFIIKSKSKSNEKVKEEDVIINVYFNDKELETTSLEDEKVTTFINEQIELVKNDITAVYNPAEIEVSHELVKEENDKYKLELSGKFEMHEVLLVESDQLDVSEYRYNSSEENIITFTYSNQVNYDLSNTTTFEIGTRNNDQVLNEYTIANNPSSYSAVINKKRRLTSDYIPNGLTSITVSSQHSGSNNMIRDDVLPNLVNLFSDAKSNGHNLTVTSAYRSYSTQETLFNNYVAKYGYDKASTFSAFPGASEHQTGLVVDIGSLDNMSLNFQSSFGTTREGIWLANNAHRYGFILRYPEGKEDITTYIYEPWHFRYVGVELATYIYEHGLTLEEFFKL